MSQPTTPADTRPNILWICTDQQRFDTIRSLGNPHVHTPNLDRLAADGMAFTRAYCTSPICTPSRASFLTGRYPRTTRARWNGNSEFPADEVLITRLLADAGYDCGLVGKLHLAGAQGRTEPRVDDGYRLFEWDHHPMPDWPDSGYQRWLAEKGESWERHYHLPPPGERHAYAGMPAALHQTTWCADKCIEFLSERRAGPWLMSVNPFDPHHPFDPPAEYLERYDPDSLPLPTYREGELANKPWLQELDHKGGYHGYGLSIRRLTPRQQRECIAAYYAMVELIDDQVGRILAALDATGQRNNTLVIFMSDHGEMLGDHGIYWKGCYFYEPLVRVPLILRWPGRVPAGRRSDALVELHDLAPFVLEAAGLPVPQRMQAKSIAPLLAGAQHHREHVLCEYYRCLGGAPAGANGTMLCDGRFKVCVIHGSEPGELYDLENDPYEFENLWDSPAHAGLKLEMLKRCFDASVTQTLDPWPPQISSF